MPPPNAPSLAMGAYILVHPDSFIPPQVWGSGIITAGRWFRFNLLTVYHHHHSLLQIDRTQSNILYTKSCLLLKKSWGKCLLYASRIWQTWLSGKFCKTFIQKSQQVWLQIRSWIICFQRKSLVRMTGTDFAKFRFPEIVVKKCCHFCTTHHILRCSFTCVWRYSMSTRGSLMRSINKYHH